MQLIMKGNVRSMQKPLSEGCSSQIQTQAGMTMYITARILEHCDLDAVASNDPSESGLLLDRHDGIRENVIGKIDATDTFEEELMVTRCSTGARYYQ